MMSIRKAGIIVLAGLLPVLVIGCNGSDTDMTQPLPTLPETTDEINSADVVITIGNLSDLTGVGANPISVTNMALEDMVRYYNENDLIPGVEMEVVTYDGQFNPARDIPGYEWLKERGADLIWSAVPATTVTLKPFLEEDQITLFGLAPVDDALYPPGYVFAAGNTSVTSEVYTLLEWVAEHDPDFPQDRPARLGATYWAEAYGEAYVGGAKVYAEAHPDQYEWIGGYLPQYTFVWTTEVEELKDCEYVLLPAPVNNFIKDYRNAGHTGKFLCTAAHAAFLETLNEADLWKEFGGTLNSRPARWWNEDGKVIDLTKQILNEYRASDVEGIIWSGSGYLAADQVYVVLELIAAAVESVGAKNFTPKSIYETAKTFSLTTDGIVLDSFNETKRTSRNYFRVYEARSTERDLFQVGPEWYPVVLEP